MTRGKILSVSISQNQYQSAFSKLKIRNCSDKFMLFLPISIFGFLGLLLLVPFLSFLGFFNILHFGFEKLGLGPISANLFLVAILFGSLFNVPLTRLKRKYVQRSYFFGMVNRPGIELSGISINVGGAIVPILLSIYLLFKVPFEITAIITILMIIITHSLARPSPRGILLPAFIPPLFSAILALIFVPHFAAPVSFISGVLGTLIGADLLNLPKIANREGILSIGGAGVFDGIFLVGITSVILTSL